MYLKVFSLLYYGDCYLAFLIFCNLDSLESTFVVFPYLDLEVTLCSLCPINTLSVCPVTRDVSFDQLLKMLFSDLTRCGVFIFFWVSLPLGGQLGNIHILKRIHVIYVHT